MTLITMTTSSPKSTAVLETRTRVAAEVPAECAEGWVDPHPRWVVEEDALVAEAGWARDQALGLLQGAWEDLLPRVEWAHVA
ncbi:unnamed protein product [Timema podura]|uniref:Uncharacterized protein n=1 Tax=Timema podura TaxID=61482 RepID=A0ABN7P9J0_TIMPD|nr:unnamed protein product [Timema podura]